MNIANIGLLIGNGEANTPTMITFAPITKNKTSIVSFGYKEIGPYYWIGSAKNGIDYYAGQTFKAPAEGLLKE